MNTAASGDVPERKEPRFYRVLGWFVRFFSPKYTLEGVDKLPAGPCVLVGNHAQMYGPIAMELYLPRPHATWCIGEMMDRREVPAYAFRDFWSGKPKAFHWFYKLLSHLIAPLAEYIFTYAQALPVYRDTRVMTTFRRSVERLNAGADIVIFPECYDPYNGILWQFQQHFSDLAALYWKRTGTVISFVPMYTAPKLGKICFGDPVPYHPDAPADEERKRICGELMASVTALAVALPEHRVVPYPNMPKKLYPLNTDWRNPPPEYKPH